jgi:hypothetical protein
MGKLALRNGVFGETIKAFTPRLSNTYIMVYSEVLLAMKYANLQHNRTFRSLDTCIAVLWGFQTALRIKDNLKTYLKEVGYPSENETVQNTVQQRGFVHTVCSCTKKRRPEVL